MQTPAPGPQAPDYLPGLPGNHVPEWVAPFLAIVILICIGAWLLMPLIRAWARRIEGRVDDSTATEELAAMRQRLAELDLTEARLHELEERLDFAERLLAQRKDQPQLPLQRTPV